MTYRCTDRAIWRQLHISIHEVSAKSTKLSLAYFFMLNDVFCHTFMKVCSVLLWNYFIIGVSIFYYSCIDTYWKVKYAIHWYHDFQWQPFSNTCVFLLHTCILFKTIKTNNPTLYVQAKMALLQFATEVWQNMTLWYEYSASQYTVS